MLAPVQRPSDDADLRQAQATRASRAVVGGVYFVLLTACAAGAYWAMFSQFAPWDDEGFFDYSLRLFLDGHTIYNQISTGYGPFYYEFWGGLLKLAGHGISTDTGRDIQTVLWVAGTAGVAASVHRMTRRFALGVLALTTTFAVLSALQFEPMQADSLVCALTIAVLVVSVFGVERLPRAACAGIGALCAALLLTKINVGAYVLAAVGFTAVMTIPTLARWRPLRGFAVLVFVLVGPGVMLATLSEAWTQYYMALAFASTLALAFVAHYAGISRDQAGDESRSWPYWLAGGFVAVFVLVMAIIFALGTTPGAMWHWTIDVTSRQASFESAGPGIGDAAVTWSLLLAAAAWIACGLRRARPDSATAGPALVGGALRMLVGVAVLLSLVNEFPFDLSPTPLFGLAMPLAWVAALAPRHVVLSTRQRFVRLLIPSLAVTSSLIAYPVPGSQVLTGSVLFIPCAAICLGDGWGELDAWWSSADRARAAVPGFGLREALTALMAAFALATVFEHVLQSDEIFHNQYQGGQALTVPGATRLRLNALLADDLDALVSTARAHCTVLWSLPGLYSLNLWTGLPTPTTQNGGEPFWLTLDAAQQRQALKAAEASPDMCVVVYNGTLINNYAGPPTPTLPLIEFLHSDFHLIDAFGVYDLELRNPPVTRARRAARS